MVDDISHEGLDEGVSFQVIKTCKTSTDPDVEAKKNRVLELYEIVDGKRQPSGDDPDAVFCLDEFGPLNLLPRPGRQRAPVTKKGNRSAARRRRATYTRPHGMRHLLAAYDLKQDKPYGHVKTTSPRAAPSPAVCRTMTQVLR